MNSLKAENLAAVQSHSELDHSGSFLYPSHSLHGVNESYSILGRANMLGRDAEHEVLDTDVRQGWTRGAG